MSAWGTGGGGASLARRMFESEEKERAAREAAREREAEAEAKAREAEAREVEAMLRPAAVAEEHWHRWPVADGSVGVPREATRENTTLVVAVAAVRPGAGGAGPLVLLSRGAGEREWFLPTAELAAGETVPAAAARALAEDACGRAGDEAAAAAAAAVVGVEHYPTLRTTWARLTLEVDAAALGAGAGACAADATLLGDRAGAAQAEWFSVSDARDALVPLLSRDFCEFLDREGRPGLGAPAGGDAAPAFPCHLARVVCVHDGRALLLEGGRLPATHVDRGENLGFSGGRLVRAAFGLVAEVDGVLGVEHNSALRLEGFRATLLATAESADRDPGFEGEPAAHLWVASAEEAAAAGASPAVAALVARALDAGLGAVPLLQVDQVMEQQNPELMRRAAEQQQQQFDPSAAAAAE